MYVECVALMHDHWIPDSLLMAPCCDGTASLNIGHKINIAVSILLSGIIPEEVMLGSLSYWEVRWCPSFSYLTDSVMDTEKGKPGSSHNVQALSVSGGRKDWKKSLTGPKSERCNCLVHLSWPVGVKEENCERDRDRNHSPGVKIQWEIWQCYREVATKFWKKC